MIKCGFSANYCSGKVQPENSGHSNMINEENLMKRLFRNLWVELREVSKGWCYTFEEIVITTLRPKGPLIGLIKEVRVLVIDEEFFLCVFYSTITEINSSRISTKQFKNQSLKISEFLD